MCVMMFDGWEWPSMMSDPRGGPCYLYTDIWLIDWLKIINNSQQHFSTTLKIPWYTFREWRDTIIVMLPFRIFMSFPCHFWPSLRVLDFFSQSEARSVSHWPIRGGGWACHDQERGWVTVAVSRRGELIKLFTLSPHSQAGSSSWLLIGRWGSVLASDWSVASPLSPPRCGKSGQTMVTSHQWQSPSELIGKLVVTQKSGLFCQLLWQCEDQRAAAMIWLH